jgi:outer membrane lipoprotein SlyB
MKVIRFAAVAAVAALAGCAQPGAELKANVYQASQVNQVQQAKVVSILAVLPAKVQANNSQNQATAQAVGGILGLVGGAALGGGLGHSFGGAALGGIGGGAAGAVAGTALVPSTALVDGVSLTYNFNGNTLNSAQVGEICEYKPGDAVMVSTGPNETRIQPNATCPEVKK